MESAEPCPTCGRPLNVPTDREGLLEEIIREFLDPRVRGSALERARRLAREEGWVLQ